jgi:hypothetical protein
VFNMARIVRLEAENIKRLRAVEIRPGQEPLVVIGGANGAGKSSTLDAISMAIGGARMIPARPVRDGARMGRVTVDLGELIVERVFLEGDRVGKLVLKSKDGCEAPEPQTLLNQMLGKLSFDPLAFSRLRPRDQLERLRELVGIDFSGLDAERAAAYAQRGDVNRAAKQKGAELAACPLAPGAPETEVSIGALTDEMLRREEVNRANEQTRLRLAAGDEAVERRQQERARFAADIERLQRLLADTDAWLDEAAAKRAALAAQCAALVDQDVGAIRGQLRDAEQTNIRVRQNQRHKSLTDQHADLAQKSADLSQRIDEIDREKQALVAAVRFPIDGLSLGEEGVLYRGFPFEQASSAEQLRVSAAIGMALNPELKVMLIRDGSLLDAESLRLLSELAERADHQIWIERVSTGEEVSVVIEDGLVAGRGEQPPAPQAEPPAEPQARPATGLREPAPVA